MKRFVLSLLAFYFFLLLETVFLLPSAAAQGLSEPSAGSVVCSYSRFYKPVEGECLMAGPVAYREKLAQLGITLPIQRLVATPLDASYARVNFNYMWVRDELRRVPVFASLDDAVQKSNPVNFLETNFSYITYREIVEVQGGKYVLTDSGLWVQRGWVTPVAVPGPLGLVFNRSPSSDFGWMFDRVQPKRTPGYTHLDTVEDEVLQPNQVVSVYAVQVIDGIEWNMIAPDRWVEGRYINRVALNTTPPEGVDNGRWVEINLYEQTLSVYDNRKLVFATLIASGLEPLWTRPGLFPINQKLESTPMSGSFSADRSDYYYLENVPWTMYFDEARALHGAYWRTKLGHPQSHGCVNLTVGDARWVFDWAKEGDWIYVWDPSGKTPTDPASYGAGGA